MIWDDHQSRCIGELSFRSQVTLPFFPHLNACGKMKERERGGGRGGEGQGTSQLQRKHPLTCWAEFTFVTGTRGSSCGRVLHFRYCMLIADQIRTYMPTRVDACIARRQHSLPEAV